MMKVYDWVSPLLCGRPRPSPSCLPFSSNSSHDDDDCDYDDDYDDDNDDDHDDDDRDDDGDDGRGGDDSRQDVVNFHRLSPKYKGPFILHFMVLTYFGDYHPHHRYHDDDDHGLIHLR